MTLNSATVIIVMNVTTCEYTIAPFAESVSAATPAGMAAVVGDGKDRTISSWVTNIVVGMAVGSLLVTMTLLFVFNANRTVAKTRNKRNKTGKKRSRRI